MSQSAELFIYVKIPGLLSPLERGRKYEPPIDKALGALQLGSVSGWGSSLGEPGADGARRVEFHRIDIDVTQPFEARAVLQRLLPELGAGPGTELHYVMADVRYQDVYTGLSWELAQRLPSLSTRHGRRAQTQLD